MRQLNRVEIVGETMRQALNELSEFAPEWVKEIAKLQWFARYGRRFEQMRLPKEQAERDSLLVKMGHFCWRPCERPLRVQHTLQR